MADKTRIALVCGVAPGRGGLAVQAANAVAGLARPGVELHVLAPGGTVWPRSDLAPVVHWHALRTAAPGWSTWPVLRRAQGHAQWSRDVALGREAARQLSKIQPHGLYAFTQVALESLEWAKARDVPSVLESPNGHLDNFRRVYVEEQRRWCGGVYHGHPAEAMVTRVEQEYRVADRIRVSSEWSRRSLVVGGVPADKVSVVQQPVDLVSFGVAEQWPPNDGPMRIVFVGTLDLRKGFVYLLHAAARLGDAVSVELVGGTVDRCTRRLLDACRARVDVSIAPGDPQPAFRRAELAVLPTLEDGSPFAAAEAMASGLPLVVTDCCGAAEWVETGATGWIVSGRDVGGLAAALDEARQRRGALRDMGRAARIATEKRADASTCDPLVAEWVLRGFRP